MRLNPVVTASCLVYAMAFTTPRAEDPSDGEPWFVDGHKLKASGEEELPARLGGVIRPLQPSRRLIPSLLRSIETL